MLFLSEMVTQVTIGDLSFQFGLQMVTFLPQSHPSPLNSSDIFRIFILFIACSFYTSLLRNIFYLCVCFWLIVRLTAAHKCTFHFLLSVASDYFCVYLERKLCYIYVDLLFLYFPFSYNKFICWVMENFQFHFVCYVYNVCVCEWEFSWNDNIQNTSNYVTFVYRNMVACK